MKNRKKQLEFTKDYLMLNLVYSNTDTVTKESFCSVGNHFIRRGNIHVNDKREQNMTFLRFCCDLEKL